jgi:hypothetical protein
MGIATVHYLSMNVQAGTITNPGAVNATVSETFTFTGMSESAPYTIVWGDATANTAVTSDASGVITQAHTYATVGSKTINVYNGTDTSGNAVATLTFTVV